MLDEPLAKRRHALGSVRFRTTASVAALFAVALSCAAVVFVSRVESSLIDAVYESEAQTLEHMRAHLASGHVPTQLPRPDHRPGAQVQLIDASGNVVAGTPGAPTDPFFVPPPRGGAIPARSEDPIGPPPGVNGQPGPRAPPFGPTGTPPRLGPVEKPLTTVVAQPGFSRHTGGPAGFAVMSATVETARGTASLVVASSLDSVHESVDAITHQLYLTIPALVALIALAAWIITGRALRPVEAITRQVEQISSKTIDGRVPEPRGRDEIAHLARTMNAMLERLHAASARQRQFVSDASHELRSPVASIRTELEVAVLHPNGTDWPAVARNVLAEDERLERIVDDLLTLAHFDERSLLGGTSELDLDEIIYAEAARARRLPVHVDDVQPAKIIGRSDELSRLVAHLLDNATRHAANRVEISLQQLAGDKAGYLALAVDDDGPGVSPEERELVFERFGRLEEGRSRDSGGAGLGLAVVRGVAERHRGNVDVVQSRLGGARFVVELPASPTPAE